MTLFHLFQKLDRVMRNRPDAQRWRVTMNETTLEVFRRPILTSEMTLGAIGIGNAPMPVPRCICLVKLDTSSTNVDIYDESENHIATTTTHDALTFIIHYIQVTSASFNDA
jgi:hypothetical protein